MGFSILIRFRAPRRDRDLGFSLPSCISGIMPVLFEPFVGPCVQRGQFRRRADFPQNSERTIKRMLFVNRISASNNREALRDYHGIDELADSVDECRIITFHSVVGHGLSPVQNQHHPVGPISVTNSFRIATGMTCAAPAARVTWSAIVAGVTRPPSKQSLHNGSIMS